eukprot:5466413-Prymnesium_polylepis.1
MASMQPSPEVSHCLKSSSSRAFDTSPTVVAACTRHSRIARRTRTARRGTETNIAKMYNMQWPASQGVMRCPTGPDHGSAHAVVATYAASPTDGENECELSLESN